MVPFGGWRDVIFNQVAVSRERRAPARLPLVLVYSYSTAPNVRGYSRGPRSNCSRSRWDRPQPSHDPACFSPQAAKPAKESPFAFLLVISAPLVRQDKSELSIHMKGDEAVN